MTPRCPSLPPPIFYPSFPSQSQSPPFLLTSVSLSVPLPIPLKPFFSLCGKHLKKKKKKAGKIPVKQCGLNISLFLGVVMASFLVMMIQSFWENSCTVSEFFDLARACVCLPTASALSLSLLSLFSKCVCVQCYVHPRSPDLPSELKQKRKKKKFLFFLFQCDGMNERKKKKKTKPNKQMNEKSY